jgi:hypothetical protein
MQQMSADEAGAPDNQAAYFGWGVVYFHDQIFNNGNS